MPDDESIMEIANNWLSAIDQAISGMPTDLIIVAHSLGASLILKYLSEYTVPSKVKRIFLLATPFWSGEKDWMEPLKLRADFAEHLPEDLPLNLTIAATTKKFLSPILTATRIYCRGLISGNSL